VNRTSVSKRLPCCRDGDPRRSASRIPPRAEGGVNGVVRNNCGVQSLSYECATCTFSKSVNARFVKEEGRDAILRQRCSGCPCSQCKVRCPASCTAPPRHH